MILAVQDGVNRYKEDLRKYVAWTNDLKTMYGRYFTPHADLSSSDFERLNKWSERLKGMEEVLGLTPEEILRIGEECGIEPTVPA